MHSSLHQCPKIMQSLSSSFHIYLDHSQPFCKRQPYSFNIKRYYHPLKSEQFQSFNESFIKKPNFKYSIRCTKNKSSLVDNKEDSQKDNAQRPTLFDDETPNFSISAPAMLISVGKQQAAGIMHHFLAFLRKNIEIVVRPASGGADIGLRWYIEWKGKDIHVLPGCSLEASHTYHGKMYLRNGRTLLDSLLKWRPIKLMGKEGNFTEVLQKMATTQKDKKTLLGFFGFLVGFIILALRFVLEKTFG